MDACPLLLKPNQSECMPLWAAARCTSAAIPFFKPFHWEDRMFLDGGFKFSCPAACALLEAECIWPNRSCDILLSLGTGIPTARKYSHTRAAHDFERDMTDAQKTWDKLKSEHPHMTELLRLDPTYTGTEFQLDDVRKLDEIEEQTEAWIATQNKPLSAICNQLIAALFFFQTSASTKGGSRTGKILCRLPVDLPARQTLIDEMLKENWNLFMLDWDGGDLFVSSQENATSIRTELCIPVDLQALPLTGGIPISVRMRSLTVGESSTWLPISGSPYVLQEAGDGSTV
jgi:hypothetical protein